ncbi:sodium channel modifier 1-like [Lytechinus pictus]|uniref:sodium channel modifier 1-like n=1 Tax=Lytechinus pictus TaxID=7653 RepID=UPI0030B9F624
MSFKREGDDGSQLNLLKKRRVAELLAKDIPDDEAMLMSNGRYACTVCHYKPVFDTVDMLTVHRAGKKHQHATENHFAKKRDLALLVRKRRQEEEIKRESQIGKNQEAEPSPLLLKVEAAKRHTLLKEAPYNPCHTHKNEGLSKKSKNKLFFQSIRQISSTNQTVGNSNLANQDQDLSHFSHKHATSVATKQTLQPGFSYDHPHVAIAGPTTAPRKAGFKPGLKSNLQARAPGVSSFQIRPYISKAKRNAINYKACSSKQPDHKPNSGKPETISSPGSYNESSLSVQDESSGGEVENSVEFIREFQSTQNSDVYDNASITKVRQVKNERTMKATPGSFFQRESPCGNMQQDFRLDVDGGEKGSRQHAQGPVPKPEFVRGFQGCSQGTHKHPQGVRGIQRCGQGTSLEPQGLKDLQDCRRGARVEEERTKQRVVKTKQKSKSKMTDEKKEELQRYLELTSSGWVQDNGGNWIKGQDVEFDSDEEPPKS